jgi:hypothetical protein
LIGEGKFIFSEIPGKKKVTKLKISALFGAGATIDLGGPSTPKLTELIRDPGRIVREVNGRSSKIDKRKMETVEFIDDIGIQLDESYPYKEADFEEIFHVIETLRSYKGGWCNKAVKGRKPPAAAFLSPRDLKWFDDLLLLRASDELRRGIFERVKDYDADIFHRLNDSKWFFDFWDSALNDLTWEVVTTNYDSCIQYAFDGNFTDGFYEEADGIKQFDFERLASELADDPNYIFNLHGCINFGHLPLDSDINGRFGEIVRFDNLNKALDTWFGRSTYTDQSGEEAISGPIITGLKKTAKLLRHPYDIYQLKFQNSLVRNRRLLICGYSFSDHHFNRFLGNFIRKNEGSMRVIIISYLEGKDWYFDWINNIDHPLQSTMKFLADNSDLIDVNRDYPTHMPECITFEEAGVRIYLKGFKGSVENNQGEEVFDYLTEEI